MCPQAEVDVSECMATVILVFNILAPGSGTTWSACYDRKGFNCNAFLLGYVQNLLTGFCFLGWYLSVKHGLVIYYNSKGKE